MPIGAINSRQRPKRENPEKENREEQQDLKASKPKFKPKAINDYYDESDEISKFRKIVSKYDITSISINDANEMYKELYRQELIELKDVLVTLDSEVITSWQELTPIISTLKANNSYATEKINFLENLKTQSENNELNTSEEIQTFYERAIEIAEKIFYFQQKVPKSISA